MFEILTLLEVLQNLELKVETTNFYISIVFLPIKNSFRNYNCDI